MLSLKNQINKALGVSESVQNNSKGVTMKISHNDNKFYLFVHFLRGIAPLFVVIAHLSGWWLKANGKGSLIQVYWEKTIVNPFHLYQDGGHLGVLIFFLISGFVVTHVSLQEDVTEFTIKRIFRIMPTLIMAILFTWLVVIISSVYNIPLPLGYEAKNIDDYMHNILLTNIIFGKSPVLTVTWSLSVEIIFYVLTALFIGYTKKEPLKATFSMIIIVMAFVLAADTALLVRKLANVIVFVLYIIVGRVVYLTVQKHINLLEGVIAACTSFLLYIYLYNYLYPGKIFSTETATMYSNVLALSIFFVSFVLVRNKSSVVSFLGDISYALYLFHIPVGCLVMNILQKLAVPFYLSFVTAVTVSIGISFVVNKFIEMPIQKMVRKINFDKTRGINKNVQTLNKISGKL